MADHDHSQPVSDGGQAHQWGHGADLAGGDGPGGTASTDSPGSSQGGEHADGDSQGGESHDQGVFRWPSPGLPRFFGQPPFPEGQPPFPDGQPGGGGDAAGGGGMPLPPRVTLAQQAPYPEPAPGPAPAGPGVAGPDAGSQTAALPFPCGLPDDYDAIDDYDAAEAYGLPDGYDGYDPGPVAGAGPAHTAVLRPGTQSPSGPDHQQAARRGAPDWQPASATPGPAAARARGISPAPPGYAYGYPAGAYAAPGLARHAPAPAAEPGQAAESADSLTADLLLPGRRRPPASGWRRALYRSSGGLIRAPESTAEQRRRQLAARACTPVAGGHHRVAVLSLKGGVGKTTTAMGLGSTLASLRGDRVIAVDANPDRGTLSDKLRLETAATVRDLLNERGQVQRYADVRAFTTQAASRLEVLASDRDPTVSVAFCEADYVDVAAVLEHYYSVCITDCGTGLLHSAMAGVLRLADQIVLVSSPSVDGARSASATLDWLSAHQYGHLVRGGVVVLSAVRPHGRAAVDMTRLERHFAARCRAVVQIPYDLHLAEGAEVDLGQLSKQAADAYLALAAEVGDGFAGGRPGAPHAAS